MSFSSCFLVCRGKIYRKRNAKNINEPKSHLFHFVAHTFDISIFIFIVPIFNVSSFLAGMGFIHQNTGKKVKAGHEKTHLITSKKYMCMFTKQDERVRIKQEIITLHLSVLFLR